MSKLEQIREDLLKKARDANTGPGVYKMLDSHREIIYVGKAKNLRNRIRSYFLASGNDERPKTKMLVAKIRDFELLLTDSEAEALILECILIKKHRPRYNIALKDDKTYPYLLIDRRHTFPKLTYARRFKRTKGLEVYGPYVSAGALKRAIQFLNQTFRLRDCSDAEFSNRTRPCINHQIGTCSAPCTNLITPAAYAQDMGHAIQALQGQSESVLALLEARMNTHSDNLEFEIAGRIHAQIEDFRLLLLDGDQKIEENNRNRLGADDKDIIGFHRNGDAASFAVVFQRNGKVIDSSQFYLAIPEDKTDREVLFDFLAQFYLARDHLASDAGPRTPSPIGTSKMIREASDTSIASATNALSTMGKGGLTMGTELQQVPPEILIPDELEESEAVFAESLKRLGYSTQILTPKRGAKSELLKLAEKNAIDAFAVEQRKTGDIYKALADLKTKLRLQNYPRRIECFDISNLGDTGIVASRVVFIEGRPEKSLYRKYKLREVKRQDDFASMREILGRRLTKSSKHAGESSEEPPDLLVVDGGKGQLAMAVEIMKELELTGIDVVGLAKARTERDFQAEEVVSSSERVFKPGRMNPIVLTMGTPPCTILARIRDEAHRFAITFQRSLRLKQIK